MARLSIHPGLLRHRLVIERAGAADGETGGRMPGFAAGEEIFALVEPLGPVVADDTGFALPVQRLQVTLRFRPGLSGGDRFRFGERILTIESAFDPDETGRFIRCLCREEGT